ncbi:ABC transporter ATP-binding protein [Desulfurococcaceae archaeon MEX13E-LK6-19]|nr:ABC transporter ATP-binding protein [Desulfurococcaceae archaeon MEX13E-LK6-19]
MVLAVETKKLSIGYMDEEENVLWVVHNINLEVNKGEIYCIVGESGCGKSTLGNAIVGILPPYAVTRGVIKVLGKTIVEDDKHYYEESRGKIVTLIPQNPGKALNPYMTIDDQFYHVLKSTRGLNKKKSLEEARKLLKLVGLDPDNVLDSYPHELSGGMQQRAAIALALATGARIVVADEPTSALDAHLRVQILNLLDELQEKLRLTVIMITHDMVLASKICDRLAVMYAGRIVEEGIEDEVFKNPLHPYTQMLSRAVPVLGVWKKLESYLGEPPEPGRYPPGCPFHPRCPYARDVCWEKEPPLVEVRGRRISCWLHGDRQ